MVNVEGVACKGNKVERLHEFLRWEVQTGAGPLLYYFDPQNLAKTLS